MEKNKLGKHSFPLLIVLIPIICCFNFICFIYRGKDIPLSAASDFFGLSHPVVRNLLQCSQGASNCLEYQMRKFEVVRSSDELSPVASEQDPATSFQSLGRFLGETRILTSSILRNNK